MCLLFFWGTVKNLGILKNFDKKLFVSSLPKDTTSVVVRPENGIRISAVIPPQKLKIRVVKFSDGFYKKTVRCNITTPNILISIKYVDVPVFGHVPVFNSHLFAMDISSTEKIMLTPYKISNVMEGGEICWGDLAQPSNLKLAFNSYFGSQFNQDLTNLDDYYDEDLYFRDYLDYVKKYRVKILKRQEFKDKTDFICGKRYWASPKGAEAVLVSADKTLLKQISEQYWFRSEMPPLIIALATKNKDFWIFESGNFKFKIAEEFVSTQSKLHTIVENTKEKILMMK